MEPDRRRSGRGADRSCIYSLTTSNEWPWWCHARRGVVSPSPGVAEIDQHGLDPPVHIALLGQSELGEDGVRVLLHRPLRDLQRGGDGGVALPLGHLAQDL